MITLYILQSHSSGRYYIGITADLPRRLAEHAAGQTRATRGRGPWELRYTEEYATRGAAMRREYQLKSWKSSAALEALWGMAQR